MAQGVHEVQEAIGLEQFLNSLPTEKIVWLHEKKPRTCVRAGELAGELAGENEQVRKQEELRRCTEQGLGKPTQKQWNGARRMPQPRRTGLKRVKCIGCKNFGDCHDHRVI